MVFFPLPHSSTFYFAVHYVLPVTKNFVVETSANRTERRERLIYDLKRKMSRIMLRILWKERVSNKDVLRKMEEKRTITINSERDSSNFWDS